MAELINIPNPIYPFGLRVLGVDGSKYDFIIVYDLRLYTFDQILKVTKSDSGFYLFSKEKQDKTRHKCINIGYTFDYKKRFTYELKNDIASILEQKPTHLSLNFCHLADGGKEDLTKIIKNTDEFTE
jgi:hypothetical protein